MCNFIFKSLCEKDTLNFGNDFAKNLKKGDVLVLSGDLGSGKTKFVEGILSYFGLNNEISSPTFTIVNQYSNSDTNIFHFDVYRLNDSSEFLEIGGDEYFDKGITIIEWGELIKDHLPKDFIKINFSKTSFDESTRLLSFKLYGDKYNYLLDYFDNFNKDREDE